MFWIDKNGGFDFSRAEIKKRILKRIDVLAECGDIPAAQMGNKFGWERRGKQFSFGGHVVDADDDHCEIMEAMKNAQLRAFHENIRTGAEAILTSFKLDLNRFLTCVSYSQDSTSYYHVPIFQFVNLDDFATATIEHLRRGRIEEVGEIFKRIAERHSGPEEWDEERRWFIMLRKALQHRAAAESRLAAAQVEQFFKWYWKFGEGADSKG